MKPVLAIVLASGVGGAMAAALSPGTQVAHASPRGMATAQFGGAPEIKLVARFDDDGDKRLNSAERHAALAFMRSQPARGFGRGGRGRNSQAADPGRGPSLTPAAVKAVPPSVPFYDAGVLRTLFIDFDDADWQDQLMAFKETDVEVPARLTVDGVTYNDVGISFRGSSSFMMVPEGLKHSMNVTMDFVHDGQNILGYRSLNLLNSHEDPSYLRAVLFLAAARAYLPAPRANFVRVAINHESWGVYSSVEQVNKDFLRTWFKTTGGARWKVPGSPGGRGGLEYWGEDRAAYTRTFEIKTKDDPKDWAALINLTRVLNQTPPERLEAALAPILDVDGALRFLALDNALVNNDGYWVRASDYTLYRDPAGRFHVLPHDTNETFAAGARAMGRRGFAGPGIPPGSGRPGGPPPDVLMGRGGGMRAGGATLDPLVGLDDSGKPLRSRLLAVPALRGKYVTYVRDIATTWLNWGTLGPMAQRYHDLIAADVKADVHKLDSDAAFDASLAELKTFVDERRAFLLTR
jgi:hypothetical protein